MVDIPHDIWCQIALYIPSKNLSSLISLNRSLFNIVLDGRYQEVMWAKMDELMIRTLIRLREPSIAARVRRFHVRAWFIEFLFKKDLLFNQSSPPRQRAKEWIDKLLARLTQVSTSLPNSLEAYRQKRTLGDISPREVLKAMVDAVNCMTGVTEYNFEWRDLPLTPLTLTFLTSARQSFGSSLRKLVLHAQLSHFQRLLSIVDFNGLEELKLQFDYDSSSARDHSMQKSLDVLRNRVAPFVNHFRSSLAGLSISSQSAVDLSTFFHSLQDFPHLQTLHIRAFFDSAHFYDPSGLHRILVTHADTLLRVELRPNAPRDLQWTVIAKQLVSNKRAFKDLQSLTITPFDGATKLACLQCLRRSAYTLTTLRLVDCYLTYDDVVQVVGVFAGRPFDQSLQRLHIETARPSRQLFDLFANQLPGLFSLHIIFEDIPITANDGTVTFTSEPSIAAEMSQVSYADWNLRDIGIWRGKRFDQEAWQPSYDTGGDEGAKLIRIIARCAPKIGSIQGFQMGRN